MRLWLKAIISIIAAIVVLPITSVAYDELYAKPYLDTQLPWLRPYVELEPFFSTIFGKLTIIVWVLLGILWVAYAAFRLSRRAGSSTPVRAALVEILVATLAFHFLYTNIAKAEFNAWNYVDVLTMYDDEFSAHQDWVDNTDRVINDVSRNRFAESNISLVIHGHLTWNSNDSQRDSFFLMQDALLASDLPKQSVQVDAGVWAWSFISSSDWTDNSGNIWRIDLIIVFTGQDCSHQALSVPLCNMMIFNHDAAENFRTVTHEFGHQYGLEHCTDPYCAMENKWMWGDNFCVCCRADLNANRDKWETDPIFFMHNSFMPPQGYTNPAGGHYYQKAKGSNVTIEAFPYDGSIFYKWVVSHRLYEIEFEEIYSNPYTFAILNAEYHIFPMYAYSRTLNLSAIGGGITLPLPGIHKYSVDEVVNVTAVCFTGLRFENWQLDGMTDTRNPITITMDVDHFLQANFRRDNFLLIVESGGSSGC